MRRRSLLAGSLGTALVGTPAFAQPAAPGAERVARLQENKRTLYRRILTRPAAAPAPTPGGQAAARLPALLRLYIYDQKTALDGSVWLEVGRRERGQTIGWVREADTVPWDHTLTAVFQHPINRVLTLFFKERDPLVAMLGSQGAEQEARRLLEIASHPPVPADFPVEALEPAEFIDIKQKFYLLPILQADPISFQDGREYRVLQIASVPLVDTPPPPHQDFTIGVAFVMDTTLSMDPYIDRIRTMLNEVVRATAAEPGRKVRFALIGFRNSLEAQPRLEYLNRIYARFADGLDPAGFAARIAGVKQTTVDSLSFNEDSYAAVLSAMNDLDWGDIQAKTVILVTDAGSRPSNDRFSATHMEARDLGAVAKAEGIAIMAIHLKTAAGINNHSYAEQIYKVLTSATFPNLPPQYYPVQAGDPVAMDQIARQIVAGLRSMPVTPAAQPPGQATPEQQAALLVYAMRLSWLGRQNQAAAPDLLRSWAADGYRGANPPECLEPHLLLTRNELSDLYAALKLIVQQGRAHALNHRAMFDQLQSLGAHLARDPERLRQHGLQSLGDLLGEYLDGLPYTPAIATMDLDQWRFLEGAPANELLDNLDSRLRAYVEFQRSNIWTNIGGTNDPADEVFPIPLSLLP